MSAPAAPAAAASAPETVPGAPAPDATTPAAAAPAGLPPSEAVNKILNVPLVSDSLKFAQQTLSGYPQVANAVAAGGNLAATGLKAAEPYAARFEPQLKSLDGLAVKGLDYAQQTFPAAFTATGAEVASGVRTAPATAQQALAQAYAARVLNPTTAKLDSLSHNEYVQKALASITSLQSTLASALTKAKEAPQEAVGQSTREADAASKNLLAELDGVRTYITSLPAETAARFQPIKETFTDAFAALSKEAAEPNVPASTKFNNILKYVKEQALPALQKAIQPAPATSAPAEAAAPAEKAVESAPEKAEESVSEKPAATPTA